MIQVDAESFFVIVTIALAAVTVAAVPRRFAPPVVVVELLMGILVGPEVLDFAKTDDFVDFFSNLGLGMLFYFAGYEIDFERIRGRPLTLGALGSVPALLKLAMFFGLFLLVRGAPALLLYRGVLAARDRAALAFYSATELPLVVAITALAVDGGHMKSSTAAGLVGAAMLSTLVFPFVGLALRRRSEAEGRDEPPAAEPQPAPAT